MKRLRLRTVLVIAVVVLIAIDAGVSYFVLPRYWRPLPPFGAITTEAQSAWIEGQIAAGKGAPEPGIGRFDPLLGWSYRPHASSDLYHINSRGWRGAQEYPPEAPPGVLRIVACGDSFTFCQEVKDEAAWPAVLEEVSPRVEVINLGVGGYGTGQAFLRLQSEDLGSRVDVVLIGMLLENIGRNVNRYRPRWFSRAMRPVAKPRYAVDGDGLRLVEQPFATRAELVDAVASGRVLDLLETDEYWDDFGLPRFLGWSGIGRLVGAKLYYGRRGVRDLWTDTDGEPFRTTVAILDAFHRHAREERGARVAPVLLFPRMEDLSGLAAGQDRYWTALLDTLAAKGIDCIDLSEPLLEIWQMRGDGGPAVYVGTHLSPEANVIVATTIADWLTARLVD